MQESPAWRAREQGETIISCHHDIGPIFTTGNYCTPDRIINEFSLGPILRSWSSSQDTLPRTADNHTHSLLPFVHSLLDYCICSSLSRHQQLSTKASKQVGWQTNKQANSIVPRKNKIKIVLEKDNEVADNNDNDDSTSSLYYYAGETVRGCVLVRFRDNDDDNNIPSRKEETEVHISLVARAAVEFQWMIPTKTKTTTTTTNDSSTRQYQKQQTLLEHTIAVTPTPLEDEDKDEEEQRIYKADFEMKLPVNIPGSVDLSEFGKMDPLSVIAYQLRASLVTIITNEQQPSSAAAKTARWLDIKPNRPAPMPILLQPHFRTALEPIHSKRRFWHFFSRHKNNKAAGNIELKLQVPRRAFAVTERIDTVGSYAMNNTQTQLRVELSLLCYKQMAGFAVNNNSSSSETENNESNNKSRTKLAIEEYNLLTASLKPSQRLEIAGCQFAIPDAVVPSWRHDDACLRWTYAIQLMVTTAVTKKKQRLFGGGGGGGQKNKKHHNAVVAKVRIPILMCAAPPILPKEAASIKKKNYPKTLQSNDPWSVFKYASFRKKACPTMKNMTSATASCSNSDDVESGVGGGFERRPEDDDIGGNDNRNKNNNFEDDLSSSSSSSSSKNSDGSDIDSLSSSSSSSSHDSKNSYLSGYGIGDDGNHKELTAVATLENGPGAGILKDKAEEESALKANEESIVTEEEKNDVDKLDVVEDTDAEREVSEGLQGSHELNQISDNEDNSKPEIVEDENSDDNTFGGDDDLCSLEDDEEESVWFDDSMDNNSEPATESLSSLEEQEPDETGLAGSAGSDDPLHTEDDGHKKEAVTSSLLGGADEASDDDDLNIVTETSADDITRNAAKAKKKLAKNKEKKTKKDKKKEKKSKKKKSGSYSDFDEENVKGKKSKKKKKSGSYSDFDEENVKGTKAKNKKKTSRKAPTKSHSSPLEDFFAAKLADEEETAEEEKANEKKKTKKKSTKKSKSSTPSNGSDSDSDKEVLMEVTKRKTPAKSKSAPLESHHVAIEDRYLAAVDCFRRTLSAAPSDEDIYKLNSIVQSVTFEKGETIIDNEQEQEACIFFIRRGKAETLRQGRYALMFLPGMHVGDELFLDAKRKKKTTGKARDKVTADTKVICGVVRIRDYYEVFGDEYEDTARSLG